jgi:hypothetical protein
MRNEGKVIPEIMAFLSEFTERRKENGIPTGKRLKPREDRAVQALLPDAWKQAN